MNLVKSEFPILTIVNIYPLRLPIYTKYKDIGDIIAPLTLMTVDIID